MEAVEKFKLSSVKNSVPPDGGWGYVVAVSFILFSYATVVPLTSFGLLYGPFLASIGDETSGTSLLSSTFVAVTSFTGLVSSFLLLRYSTRMTGMVGATLFSLGYFLEIFETNFVHMILCYGFLKGFGYGLMLPSSLTSMNNHFNKKLNFMMGVCQTVTSVGTIAGPLIVAYLMENLGFRKTLAALAGLSLLNFPAMATFRPLNRDLKQKSPESSRESVSNCLSSLDHLESQVESFLPSNLENEITSVEPNVILPEDNAKSSSSLPLKDRLLDTIGLRLLGDIRYLNMAVGLSLPYITDAMFLMLIRMILNNVKFETSEIALMMAVYFIFDVISKVSYSALCGFYVVDNRSVFLVATLLAAVLRIVFILVGGRTWKMVSIALIGLSKGIQETPLPMVVSDMYKETFSTAFSLYMVISGCLFFIIGALTSYVKDLTKSDSMIIYMFAIANFITCFSWITESIFVRLSARKSGNKQKS